MSFEEGPGIDQRQATDGSTESDVEGWVPLSVREAREARARLKSMEPYVWMNLGSMILLIATTVIMAYRMGAQSCH